MDDANKAQLALNLTVVHRKLSTWAMSAAGVLGAVWFSLPAEQQRALIEHSPLPAWSYPIALTVIGVVAGVWPQKSVPGILNNPAAPAADTEKTT